MRGSDVHRINDLIKTAKTLRKATVLKDVSSSLLGTAGDSPEGGRLRQREDKIHSGATTLVGRSDAAYGGQSSLGECHPGYVIGLTSSTLSGPCHIIQRPSNSTPKMAKGSHRGEVYAFSETLGHMPRVRGFYGHFRTSIQVWRNLGIARISSRAPETRR